MMNMLRLLTASTAVLLVGCGAPSLGPTVASTSGCPTDGCDAAVIWSSESAPSQLDYVRGDAVVDSRALPYQGLEPAPAEAPFRQGPDAWLVANGNTTRDSTHVLRWSQADWSTTAHRVDEQVIWSVVADDDAFYTTNTVNAEAQVRRRTPDGQLTGEARIPSTVFSSLALDGDRLHAVGSTGEPGTEQTVLITFDATTLAEENRVILGPSSFPVSTLVHEVVAESTNYLTFAHTLLNPAFRAMDEYRAVTLFDPDSETLRTVVVGNGLRQIAVSGDDLLVLTQQGEDGPARLTRYALADMSERSGVYITPPSGGQHYLSGILTNLPAP